jgi:hypothetical protein
MRARIVGAALSALLLVGVGACGGGGSSKTAASDGSDTKSSSSKSSGSGSEASFCKELKKDVALFSDSSDSSDTSNVADALDRLAKAAPSEIRSDMQAVAEATKKQLEIFESIGSDFSDLDSALSEFSDSIDTAKLDKAQKNVEKFAKDKCDVDLSSSDSSS